MVIGIKNFFGNIDAAIYNFIAIIFNCIEYLSQIDLFKSDVINGFTSRIYTILGIFMLFKVSFSFINYIIDPDKFMDKKTGFSKMIVNIIVVFIMLMSVPWAFSILKGFQEAILNDHVLSNFILGREGTGIETENGYRYAFKYDESCENYVYVKNQGVYFSLLLFRPFYQYSNEFSDPDKRSEGVLCTGFENMDAIEMTDVINPGVYLATEELYGQGVLTANKLGETFSTIVGTNSPVISTITQSFLKYQVHYMFFLSTLVGIAVLGLLLSFALDIAVRSIKLGFLQIVAPIPIISYMDPDKSKHKMFTSWLKEIGKTWISLFIRLGALYFLIYILEILETSNIFENININWFYKAWIILFYLIGALIFAKKLPSWIESLTGIKFDGTFTLNPLKKIKNEALGGGIVTGAAVGLGASAITGVAQGASNLYSFHRDRSNLRTAIANEEDPTKKKKLERKLARMNGGRAVLTTVGGLGGGIYRGLKSGYNNGQNGKFNVFSNVGKDVADGSTRRNNRADINFYNSEVEVERQEEIRKLQDRQNDITRDQNKSDEQKRTEIAEIEKQKEKINKDYANRTYGFMKRNFTERFDNYSGVRNEYSGYGFYDKKIRDLERAIEDNNQMEQVYRHQLKDICSKATTAIGQDMGALLDLRKLVDEAVKNITVPEGRTYEQEYTDTLKKVFDTYAAKNRMDRNGRDELEEAYNNVKVVLNNITKVDEDTASKKSEKKNYESMANTHQNLNNK